MYVAAAGGRFAVLGEAAATAGAVFLAAGIVVRLPAAIPWAIALAGGGYVAGREHHATADGWAAVVGGALLLSAELAAWSIDHDRRIVAERALVTREIAVTTVLVGASMLVGFVLVGAAAVSSGAGLALTVVGVAATVASVAVILRLART